MQMAKTGNCKLTGHHGAFVKSHIIPRAFTDKSLDKIGRIQAGQDGERPSLRYTSWYDDEIVTLDGERILTGYDTDATREIRRLGLCWRFFPVSNLNKSYKFDEFEMLEFSNVQTNILRLFFLSVLWRAAISKRREFQEIRIDVDSLRKLRGIVSGKFSALPADFPLVLVLLRTKGQSQCLTPLRQRVDIPQFVPGLKKDIKIFRFFFDGLIVHISRKANDQKTLQCWKPRAVGIDNKLVVIARDYEGSFQEANLNAVMNYTESNWPAETAKIYGTL